MSKTNEAALASEVESLRAENAALLSAVKGMRACLDDTLKRYICLGKEWDRAWNPEHEPNIIAARKALLLWPAKKK